VRSLSSETAYAAGDSGSFNGLCGRRLWLLESPAVAGQLLIESCQLV